MNGIPLGLVETKAPTHDWKEAARDFKQYWVDAPELERYAAVCVATNGLRSAALRVAPEAPPPTPSGETRGQTRALTSIASSRSASLAYSTRTDLADVAANFIVFETRLGNTTKKLARYQQFRAANKLGETSPRRPVRPRHRLAHAGLWQEPDDAVRRAEAEERRSRQPDHLHRHRPPRPRRPDQRDVHRLSVRRRRPSDEPQHLRDLLVGDQRGVIITTVQKFEEEMAGPDQRQRHRARLTRLTAPSWAARVRDQHARRAAEGKAFRLHRHANRGNDRSTRKAFSPEIGGTYENYLDAYSPNQAVEDGATVETALRATRLVESRPLPG